MEEHRGLFLFISTQRRQSAHLVALIVVSITLLIPTIAFAANNDPFRSGREAVNPKQSAGVGQSTGAMTYSYPLVIPPGRNGVQPNLSLNYSSDDKRPDSIFGYGWSMTLPYIERVNKLGTNNLYNQDTAHTFFTSSISGELLPVVNSTPIGGSFLGMILGASPLALLETSEESNTTQTQSEPTEQSASPAPDPTIVSDEIAQSFHTFADTFSTAFVYHPNEEGEWNSARERGTHDAKLGIPGFPVAGKSLSLVSVIPNPLTPALENLPATERATLKGEAIAQIGSIPKTLHGDYWIEVTAMNPIEGGVELFARAWDTNDDPIGFGQDGTVETERFRIFNPPILVDDPNGTIVRTWTDEITNEVKTRTLREDPVQAITETLLHTISLVGREDTQINAGSVGNTTDIFYPSTDGRAYRIPASETFATIRAGAGQGSPTGETSAAAVTLQASGTSNQYNVLTRGFFLFDTSPIGTDSISSSTLSLVASNTSFFDDFTDSVGVVAATTASDSDVANSDFEGTVGNTTRWATDRTIASLAHDDATYNSWTLNATGIAGINKTGITKIGLKSALDIDNTAPTWGSELASNVIFYFADNEGAGTTADPKLVVVHSAVPQGPTSLLLDDLTNPSNIATSSPYFSAIHANASTTALATSYQIQVDTAGTFTAPYWDSGKRTLSSSTPAGMRSPNIYATSTFALDGTTYYWRLRFYDQMGGVGDYSTATSTFRMRSASTVLQDLNYTYDAVGNIITIQDYSGNNAAASTTYTYDNLYRLTRASSTDAVLTNWLQTYAYDDLGNITSKSDVGSYTYAGTGWANPHAPTTVNGVTYGYDAAGNLTSAGAASYFWNYRNRLTDTNVNSTTTHYQYDHLDQRVQQDVKIGASATSSTIYWSKLFETKGATTTLYVFLPNGELLATVEGNGSATSTYIAHTDHQGSTNVMSDKNGNLAQLATYYPFGGKRNNELSSNGFQEKRGFIGQYEDAVVQLSYLNARYYDITRGQFASEDPLVQKIGLDLKEVQRLLLDPQLQNYYSYARNNPINLSDPSGEATIGQLLSQISALLTQLSAAITKQYSSTVSSVSSTLQTVSAASTQQVSKAVNTVYNFHGGAGLTFGGETSVGVRSGGAGAGVTAQQSYSFGVFKDKGFKFSIGGFKSYGNAFAAGDTEVTSAELNMCPVLTERPVIFGLSYGVGVGGFVAPNAGSVNDLLGTSNSVSYNAPFGSFQYSLGEQPTYALTYGPHLSGVTPGASYTQLPVSNEHWFSTSP
ncbi:MAG: hypothetical protein A2942_01090 [Candidatus Lloydbacteria bacterium RIFCSPLOWO2_01_FULL_50_20]|uniref:Teneurin-like YD-shell domain-containing protein n=1 Tax=Candidatus Lloydbacteria bacterium RIFCSPLOWO2_01_FULL_50_20 TaxID=1798665 RepID=A0A1G2DIC0_9BACT|nr:MAG: hypothetical protein A2942_01090 [Candidatus Lloydbacteria bacterium RIFCSPLOWO2_01_FULL_50_20]